MPRPAGSPPTSPGRSQPNSVIWPQQGSRGRRPGHCDIALRTYQASLVPALAERCIQLVAISPQTPDGSLSTKETKETKDLTFTVLSDPGNQIASVK